MATASASIVQYGRRKGSSRTNTPIKRSEVANVPMQLPDLRQVHVFPKAEWERVQESLNKMNREAELIQEKKQEKEALHLCSKEVVKHWSNTIAGQRQKKIKAKKLREEIEEQEKRKIDFEEAQYQAEKRREAIERAKTLQYYQTDRVKGFHSALVLTEVLKEREAQIDLKRKKQNAHENVNKDIMAQMQRKEEQAIIEDQHKALQQFQECKAVASGQMQQVKEHQHAKEMEKLEDKKEGETIQRLTRLYEWEKSKLEDQKHEEKKQLMNAYLDHMSNRDILKAIEKQKYEEEQESIHLFSTAKQKMIKMRKEKEAELFREQLQQRDRIVELLAKQMQEKQCNEDEIIARAVAEQEAKEERKLKEKEEKRIAELKSISTHRVTMIKQKEEKEKEERLQAVELLHAKQEAAKVFFAKQWEKQQNMREKNKKIQDLHVQQMAENHRKALHEKEALLEYEKQNSSLIALEEKQFQAYASEVIDSAVKAKRNPYPLRKAARMGFGGGLGPVFGGLRPSYLAQDITGVELPNYNRSTTQDIKAIYDTDDIQKSRKKLGFTW
ncbi:coiled-coil domain-containing protein 173-like [Acipenser oxyrinchus oxyrinchus]|uniref:Coiled-coil domain-containing protein 173-like n=1 Tax=Acipenser oxyrinchus oxyrinchus TaxID=40147 RepID=A0AAD8G5E5_ACIOX|nr:coiled-coil domain-containing protein 173-like [Acipenser oxyrinchus oxyrinchus]